MFRGKSTWKISIILCSYSHHQDTFALKTGRVRLTLILSARIGVEIAAIVRFNAFKHRESLKRYTDSLDAENVTKVAAKAKAATLIMASATSNGRLPKMLISIAPKVQIIFSGEIPSFADYHCCEQGKEISTSTHNRSGTLVRLI